MKMLFILGYRRSGTTALQRQMQLHPDVMYFDGGVTPTGQQRNEFHLFDLIDAAPKEYEALFRHHCGRPPSGDPTADAEAVFARCRLPVGLVKSTRIIMRHQAWLRFKEWASATQHDVRIIAIARFPLDTLSSDEHTYGKSLIPDDRTLSPVTAQSVWAEAYARLLDDPPDDANLRWLRLEDVIARPIDEIGPITSWLDLRPFTRSINWLPLNQGRWRQDPIFLEFQISPEIRDVATRLGYAL